MSKTEQLNCEYCGDEIKDGEMGDVDGAIACPDCLGWYKDARQVVQEIADEYGVPYDMGITERKTDDKNLER